MFEFWLHTGGWIILGTIAMSFMEIARRIAMNPSAENIPPPLSPLQFLMRWNLLATCIFSGVYLFLWGPTLPKVLPGFFTAAFGGLIANSVIQFANVKAASYKSGEVSLTKPIQSMTPGLILFGGLFAGEIPGWIGMLGVLCMAVSSYLLAWEKKPEHWWGYLNPFKKMTQLLNWSSLDKKERETTIVVWIAFTSACFGAIGLFFDGLYTRRGVNMQGLTLASIILIGGLSLVYSVIYKIRPDSRPEQRNIGFFKGIPAKQLQCIFLIAVFWVIHIYCIQPTYLDTYVAYTGTLKRISVLMSVILAYTVLGEQGAKRSLAGLFAIVFKRRFIAAVLTTVGAVLISKDGAVHRISKKIERFVEINVT